MNYSRFLNFALLALILLVISVYKIDLHTYNKARTGELEGIRMDADIGEMTDEVSCLKEALYFETAHPDSYEGVVAVALVIRNRTLDPEFPHTYCGVIHQEWYQGSYLHCEFSYYCDGKPEVYTDPKWEQILAEFARAFIVHPPEDITHGRKFYYSHKYFSQNNLKAPQWWDCEVIGSQTFCQGLRPPKTQVAQN